MTYSPEPKHAARSKTVLVNTAVAAVAVLSLLHENGTALAIPSEWLARISFAGAVLTIILRRCTYARPIHFRRRMKRKERWSDPAEPDVLDEQGSLFV